MDTLTYRLFFSKVSSYQITLYQYLVTLERLLEHTFSSSEGAPQIPRRNVFV